MKKILVLSICFLFAICSYGQLDEKTWLVGGQGEIQDVTPEIGANFNNYLYIMLQPKVGKFSKGKLAVGLQTPFEVLNPKTEGINTSTTLGLGTFVRYYFLESKSTLNLIVEPSYTYVFPLEANSVNHSHILSGSAGPVIFFNDVAALEVLLNYTYRDYVKYPLASRNFGLKIGFMIHLQSSSQ